MSLARPNPDHRSQPDLFQRFYRWRNNLVANPTFQKWASRFYLTRSFVRRDGERLFDLVAGFVHSQVLQAVVELDLLTELKERPRTIAELAFKADIPADRMQALCNAAAALDLMTRRRDGTYGLARLGAATLGVPGLADMIRHHSILYRDLEDPTAFLRGERETELARFWPYVFGESDPETSATYSRLMAETQAMVAEETLDAVDLGSVSHLMDVGGGTGAFLRAVRERHPKVSLTLFDLPDVVAGADVAGQTIRMVGGHFTESALPRDIDAISLVRVLYDHSDETVMSLLANVSKALPPGGRLIISEPMAGDRRPERATDAYFAFYTMAMQTGRVRSASDISAMLAQLGFVDIRKIRTRRPFITGVVTARRPENI